MNITARIIFLVLAIIFFSLAAFGVKASVDWTNAGFAAVTAAFLVS